MASQLDDIEKIFQDISNHSKVKSLETCNEHLDTNFELQLQKHKNHFATLKTRLIRLQAQSHFLENMAKENWSSTDEMEITEHQENMRKESKEDRQAVEQLENDMDDLSETLSTKHKVLKEKLELLEQRLSSTKDKKNKFEMLKGKLEEMADKVEQEENKRDCFEELRAKQVEASMVIEQCKTAISSLEHCKGLLQVDASHLEDNANELLQDFMMQQTMKQNNQGHDITLRQWVASAVELYSNLGEVRVQSMQGDTVVLEIPSDAQPEDEPVGVPLILTIKFRLEGGTRVVFAGAEVNLDSLSIEDLIDETICNEDVVGFILQVKRRFRNQRSLIKEIEELQANYAMDWEPSHSRIRVMLGRSGKIVCTLKVDPMYCIGKGNIQLLGVEGSSSPIEHLQSEGPTRNLTEWIKALQELFSAQ